MACFKFQIFLFKETDTIVASAIPPSFHSRRSASLGAHSRAASVPQSSSAVSSSRASSVVSMDQFGKASGGPSKLSKEQKDSLLSFLGIDLELPYSGPPGLPTAYQKWKVIDAAKDKVLGIKKDPEWIAFMNDDPFSVLFPEFIDIFVANSQYYQVWKPKFERAEKFPDLVDWLNEEDNCLSSEDLFSLDHKRVISFSILETCLQKMEHQAAQEHQAAWKGKGKANSVSPRKKHNSRDREVEKRKHKKMSEKEKKE